MTEVTIFVWDLSINRGEKTHTSGTINSCTIDETLTHLDIYNKHVYSGSESVSIGLTNSKSLFVGSVCSPVCVCWCRLISPTEHVDSAFVGLWNF